jgi:hypothetical protein
MPITRSRPLAAALVCVGAVVTLVIGAGPAVAGKPAQLRVVSGDGKTFADARVYTGTTRVPTSRRANCFFGGVGGSGNPATVQGPNALGVVADGARLLPRLRPLLVTDEFSFGLGVCGIGGARGNANRFWSVRVNRRALQVGGDQVRLRPGDRVLWALIPNPVCEPDPPFNCDPGPPELELRAPARARRGDQFAVRVLQWSDTGQRSVAPGVTVNGAAAPTDANGVTQVSLARTRKLVATRSGAIASAPVGVCVAETVSACPRVRGRILAGSPRADTIRGTPGGDRIKGGGGRDRIKARGGSDLIRVRRGGRDRVNCGPGRDRVIADRRDRVARNCERVRRR